MSEERAQELKERDERGARPRDGRARRTMPALWLCPAVLVAGGGMVGLLGGTNLPEPAAQVGFRAPDFDLPVLGESSRHVRLSEMPGRPVIVVFNCGCKACNHLDRELAAAAPRLGDAQVVAITTHLLPYEGKKLATSRQGAGFRRPILADAPMGTTMRYQSTDCPRTWLVDSRGVIRCDTSGPDDPPAG